MGFENISETTCLAHTAVIRFLTNLAVEKQGYEAKFPEMKHVGTHDLTIMHQL